MRRTKIIATLGPATDRPGVLEAIIRAGLNVARLNLSHGQPDDHRRRAAEVREAAASIGSEVAILADLQGPKIRIGAFANGPIELQQGQKFALHCSKDAPLGDETGVSVTYLGLVNDVMPGDTLMLDDGLIALEVHSIEAPTLHCIVSVGGMLSDRKGINRLGGGLSVAALSQKDREDIKLAAEIGADYLAVSFASSAADMNQARALLRAAGSRGALMAKIERAEAITNLGEIIDASDAVLVARGDLGVEIGFAELPGLQKKIIRESLIRNRVVVTATQMLQSMVENPIPTRAEVLDVANAVIDGTDAVMLSQESASGKYPEKAVLTMANLCLTAERQFGGLENLLTPAVDRVDQAIAMAAMHLADKIKVRAIIALTESGATAQWLSRYRSPIPIYAMSRHTESRYKMALFRDVYPVDFDPQGSTSADATRLAVELLYAQGKLSDGDRVVVTTGDHTGVLGGTNTLKLLRIGAGGVPEGLANL